MINKFQIKKLLCLCLTLSMALGILTACSKDEPVSENEKDNNNSIEVTFDDFKYETTEYNSDEVEIEYNDDHEIAIIKEKDTNTVLEEISIEKEGTASNNEEDTNLYTFKKTKSYGSTKVILSSVVEVYSSGSCRQINSIKGSYLDIVSDVPGMKIEDEMVAVWSPGDEFPTTKLLFSYNGTLKAEMDNVSEEMDTELSDAGFYSGNATSTTKVYRTAINDSGYFSLY